MSRIDDLIAEHCPGGVEFRRLGDVARIRNGKGYKSLGPGDVPVYGSGGIMTYVDTFAYDKPSVLIPRKGSLGNLFLVDAPFWNVDTIFYTEIDESIIQPRFLYYFLKTLRLGEMNQAGGVPSLTQSVLNELRIATPPLAVQHEIVAILDRMTELEADLRVELEAELEARSRQYAHYRDSLLTFSERERVRWSPVSELGTLYSGLVGKTKEDFREGNVRFVTYSNVLNNLATNTSPFERVRIGPDERQNRVRFGDVLFTASSESVEEVGMSSGVVEEPEEVLYLNSFCFGFRPNDVNELGPEFAKHLFRATVMRDQIKKTANGVTRINVSKERFRRISVPVPSPTAQARIASVLDKFDALLNDLSSGLPAEIRARRQQYEYYRDRLLSFEEASV